MLSDAILLSLIVGACTWGFRFLPLRLGLQNLAPGGAVGRFLAATGPAAIATLFAAEIMPHLAGIDIRMAALAAGLTAVLAVFYWRRSAVLATIAGSVAYGVVVALTGA